MAKQSHALSRPWLDPDRLIDLIDVLRDAGYNIGVAQYVAAQDLLLALAARGERLDDPRRLAGLLGPVLCSSPSEQENFQTHFDQWVKRLGTPSTKPPQVAPSVPLAKELERVERGSLWWLAAAAVVGSGVVFLLNGALSSPAPSEPLLPENPAPDGTNIPLLLLALLVPVAVLAGRWLWLRYRANRFLTRRATTHEPEVQQVAIDGHFDAVVPPPLMFRIAQGLRRRVEMPSDELNIEATIAQTVEHGGWFTPVYARRLVLPEYLVLIDRATFGDHQARVATEMVGQLVQYEVLVTRYYFDGDPRVCFPPSPRGEPLTLAEVAARHGQRRLVIFSDARGLFSSLTGEQDRWTEIFQTWTERAVLSPAPPAEWGYREQALAQQFVVLPATVEGLAALVPAFYDRKLIFDMTSDGRAPMPAALQVRPRRWISPDPLDASMVERALKQLRVYLGDAGYYWLCACAVYPALSWNLTLYLGGALRDRAGAALLESSSLLDLARLPWFRYGRMPDWLRALLILDMPPEQVEAVRVELAALLITAVRGRIDDAQLEIVRKRGGALTLLARPLLRRLERDAAEDSPQRDYVFLNFMATRRERLLAVQAPEALQRLLRGRAIRSFRRASVREMLRQSLTLCLKPTTTSFGRVRSRGGQREALIYVVAAATLGTLLALLINSFMGQNSAGTLLISYVTGIIGFITNAFLLFFVGRLMKGTGTQREVFYTVSLYTAPFMACNTIISTLGSPAVLFSLVPGLYGFYLSYCVCRWVVHLSRTRSIITILLVTFGPWLILFLLIFLLIFLLTLA
jgi:hypothetical protein